MIQRHARNNPHIRYPMPNAALPISHPIRLYMIMHWIMVVMMPPRNKKDLLWEKSETAENEAKAPVE